MGFQERRKRDLTFNKKKEEVQKSDCSVTLIPTNEKGRNSVFLMDRKEEGRMEKKGSEQGRDEK